MATPEYYTGDTWPPLTGTAKNAAGNPQDISSADSLRAISKRVGGTEVIAGTAVFKEVVHGGAGNGTDGEWQYVWDADDLTLAGEYIPELEVTWDELSSPPKVETFRLDSEKFIVHADND
jgi:hypothetical protein